MFARRGLDAAPWVEIDHETTLSAPTALGCVLKRVKLAAPTTSEEEKTP
jgi:hypothetical protein